MSTLVRENRAQLCKYNSRQLSRVYPGGGGAAGLRLDSSNPPPSEVVCAAWASGCQMVALNFQRWDEAMQINHDLFRLNAGCGYVLKPSSRRTSASASARRSTWRRTSGRSAATRRRRRRASRRS